VHTILLNFIISRRVLYDKFKCSFLYKRERERERERETAAHLYRKNFSLLTLTSNFLTIKLRAMTLMAVLMLVFGFAGCGGSDSGDSTPPPSGPPVTGESLTLSNGPSSYEVVVTSATLSSTSTFEGVLMTAGLIASGTGGDSSFELTWIGNFTGTYNVLIFSGVAAKYQNSISFSSGVPSTTLDWNSMSDATVTSVGTGTGLTVDHKPGGVDITVSIFAYAGEIPSTPSEFYPIYSSYLTTGHQIAGGMSNSSPVKIDAIPGAPSTYTGNDTYTVAILDITNGTARFFEKVVFSGGEATVDYDNPSFSY